VSSKAPAPEDAADGVSRLTERERAVLRLLARGHDGKSAARALGIPIGAVHAHSREACARLGTASIREAAERVAAAGEERASAPERNRLAGPGDAPVSAARRAQRRFAAIGLGLLALIGIVVGTLALWAVGRGPN
jgi:DNA-binding CsgD family transcriptional regulator